MLVSHFLSSSFLFAVVYFFCLFLLFWSSLFLVCILSVILHPRMVLSHPHSHAASLQQNTASCCEEIENVHDDTLRAAAAMFCSMSLIFSTAALKLACSFKTGLFKANEGHVGVHISHHFDSAVLGWPAMNSCSLTSLTSFDVFLLFLLMDESFQRGEVFKNLSALHSAQADAQTLRPHWNLRDVELETTGQTELNRTEPANMWNTCLKKLNGCISSGV